MNIILNDEYDYFLNKKKKLDELHLEAWKRVWAACEESETFHDNPEMEYARDDQQRYSKQIGEINELLSKIKILKPEDVILDWKVKIWTVIDLDIDWEEKTYKIWWADTSLFDDRVSYKAPLIKPLLWKVVNEEIEVTIAWVLKEITILNVKWFDEK